MLWYIRAYNFPNTINNRICTHKSQNTFCLARMYVKQYCKMMCSLPLYFVFFLGGSACLVRVWWRLREHSTCLARILSATMHHRILSSVALLWNLTLPILQSCGNRRSLSTWIFEISLCEHKNPWLHFTENELHERTHVTFVLTTT